MPRAETCARCGQELRWGWRGGVETWWHREAVDHNPIFGNASVPKPPPPPDPADAKPDNTIIPEPEVYATPIEIGDPRMPNGAKDRINQAREFGRTAVAKYSRGPRTHALYGTLLGISDYVQVDFALDGTDRRAVASWEDGALSFAYTYTVDKSTRTFQTRRVNNNGLKAWIKGEDE